MGPHKTGTTAIQKFLVDNTKPCFQQNLVYPKRYLHIFGHHHFREILKERQLRAEDLEFFSENQNDFLLSSEDFISLDEADFQYLRQSLDNFDIKIIFSWRRASFKLYSIWQEVIKHGGTVDFFEYYHDHVARPGTSQMLSPDLKLNTLAKVFGKQNVKVIDYDASSNGNTLYQDFVNACDLVWSDNFSIKKIDKTAKNESMKLYDIEIVRALNNLMGYKYGYQGSKVRLAYSRFKDALPADTTSELVSIIDSHTSTKIVGNYFVDTRAEKVMMQRFGANILNHQVNNSTKLLRLASSRWLSALPVHDLLSNLASKLNQLNTEEQEDVSS